jgi:hypothetical protein
MVAAAVAAAIAGSAHAALFFLFDPTTAEPGHVVTIRLGGTPRDYDAERRKLPLQRPIRVYLVPAESAAEIRGRFDRRLHFVGSVRPDRTGRGALTFALPPLDAGIYVVAAWCPGCARFSFGNTFSVQTVPRVSRYRDEMAIQVALPSPARSCPVTKGPYGNGLLSTPTPRPDGTLTVLRDQRGLFQKLGWLPHRGLSGQLSVRGERLDAPGRLNVLSVNWGYSYAPGKEPRGSWASAVTFPSEGCWRLTGRVRDVSLTYVVRVVASS